MGPGTSEELAGYHLKADAQPEQYRAEALAAMLKTDARGRRFLLVRASRGREVLGDELIAAPKSSKSSSTPAATCRKPTPKSPPPCPTAGSIGSRSPARPSLVRWARMFGPELRQPSCEHQPNHSGNAPRAGLRTSRSKRPSTRWKASCERLKSRGEGRARGARERRINRSRERARQTRYSYAWEECPCLLSPPSLAPSLLFRRIADRAEKSASAIGCRRDSATCWKSTVTRFSRF